MGTVVITYGEGVRHWTLDEATAELPEVTMIIRRVRQLVTTSSGPRGPVPGSGVSGQGISGNGHRPSVGTGGHDDTELVALLTDLDHRGIIVRDPDRGLIDFPALSASGTTYLLCWLDGEAAIEWWHWPDAGFAGRTPLSSPPD